MAHTIDSISDLVFWLDQRGRYVLVNRAATDLLGYTTEEVLARHVWDLDPIYNQAKWDLHWKDVEKAGSFKVETINRTREGVDIPMEVTTNLVYFDGVAYNCAILRDIRERKQSEAKVRALHDTIYRLSITDALTGLANRRSFDSTLSNELRRHGSSREALSVLMLDVDLFKKFNDHYGHVAGDDCLQNIARVLAGSMRRGGDLAARYGGEEFACVLPNTSAEGAEAVAHAVHEGVAQLAIAHEVSPVAKHVSCSIGALTVTDAAVGSERDILRAADRLLYKAKRKGRNCVITHTL